jgi:hypothetical protein
MDAHVRHPKSGPYNPHHVLERHSSFSQSSLPLAWKNFTPAGRIKPSSNRDRLVDVCEELVKVSMIVGPQMDFLNDRYSEREEKREKGRLLTQAEKEADKDKVIPSAAD